MKVLRYEIKNIEPPADILAAMEKQMRAEREKRAVILTSEGQRDAAINTAEGEKQQVIKASEAKRQQQINEAEGQASAIRAVASATAQGIREVADAIRTDGGMDAVQLRVAEQYVDAVRPDRAQDEHGGRAGQRHGRGGHDCRGDEGVRDVAAELSGRREIFRLKPESHRYKLAVTCGFRLQPEDDAARCQTGRASVVDWRPVIPREANVHEEIGRCRAASFGVCGSGRNVARGSGCSAPALGVRVHHASRNA